jgi:hypothetical protein
MYLVAIAWLYVALMMALAEAVHPAGGWLGAVITFVLYGLAPVSLVMYLMATPLRRRARQREALAERAALAQAATTPQVGVTANVGSTASAGGSGGEPDHGGHAPGLAVAPVREVP